MEIKKNILCMICMRGGSKGVPNKNIRPLCKKPLLAYTIETALKSNLFYEVIVSTDSEDISNLSIKYGAKSWFLRPTSLAMDETDKLPVRQHALEESEKYFKKKFDFIFDLDATSPLRKVKDLHNSFNQFLQTNSEILISGCIARKNPYFNMVEISNDCVNLVKRSNTVIVRRQDSPQVYDMNASIYIWKRHALLEGKSLFGEKTTLYTMPEERSVDIDTELDWEIVSYLMGKRLNKLNG